MVDRRHPPRRQTRSQAQARPRCGLQVSRRCPRWPGRLADPAAPRVDQPTTPDAARRLGRTPSARRRRALTRSRPASGRQAAHITPLPPDAHAQYVRWRSWRGATRDAFGPRAFREPLTRGPPPPNASAGALARGENLTAAAGHSDPPAPASPGSPPVSSSGGDADHGPRRPRDRATSTASPPALPEPRTPAEFPAHSGHCSWCWRAATKRNAVVAHPQRSHRYSGTSPGFPRVDRLTS
jgi:hypothetical protein